MFLTILSTHDLEFFKVQFPPDWKVEIEISIHFLFLFIKTAISWLLKFQSKLIDKMEEVHSCYDFQSFVWHISITNFVASTAYCLLTRRSSRPIPRLTSRQPWRATWFSEVYPIERENDVIPANLSKNSIYVLHLESSIEVASDDFWKENISTLWSSCTNIRIKTFCYANLCKFR